MIKHPLKTEKIKENTVKYTLKIEGDNIGDELRSLVQLLNDLVSQPQLLKCGDKIPDEIRIIREDNWVAISTAVSQVDMTNVYYTREEDDEP